MLKPSAAKPTVFAIYRPFRTETVVVAELQTKKEKIMKKIVVLAVLAVMVVTLAGCKKTYNGASSNKSISVNLAKDQATLKNVVFYNFNDIDPDYAEGVYTRSGTYAVLSNSYNSNKLIISDKNGLYILKTDQVLSSLPDTMKLYKSEKCDSWDVYVRED